MKILSADQCRYSYHEIEYAVPCVTCFKHVFFINTSGDHKGSPLRFKTGIFDGRELCKIQNPHIFFFQKRGVGTKSPLLNTRSPFRIQRKGFGDGTTSKLLPYFLSCHKSNKKVKAVKKYMFIRKGRILNPPLQIASR